VRVSLQRTLSARFPGRPEITEIGEPIQVETDLQTLLHWYEAVAVAGSLEQVQTALVPTDLEGAAEPSRLSAPENAWCPCPRAFFENRKKFPREKLLAFAGQYIAWSPDGANILASDPDEAALYHKLQA